MEKSGSTASSIRDNHTRGSVGEFLSQNIKPDADLSIISAYFTIYAYERLKHQLNHISSLRFLFGEPTFLKSLDPSKMSRCEFRIEDDQLIIPVESRMTQKAKTTPPSAPLLSKEGNNAGVDTSALEKRIDEMIYALYGLTEEEIAVVEGKR